MLITVASQVKSSVVASTREKDKVFVSVLAGVTLAQLAIVSCKFNSKKLKRTIAIRMILVVRLYDHIKNGANDA